MLVVASLVFGLAVRVPERASKPSHADAAKLEVLFERISADSMIETVKFLANQQTRRYTTAGAAAAVQYITARLEALGYAPEHRHVATLDEAGRPFVVVNVVVDLGGPAAGGSSLLVCAHYDSRGRDDEYFAPGADDNASGVAVLLEAARVFAETGVEPRVTFAFFGGEEDSLIGSRAFADEVSHGAPRLRGVINVDMVGYDAYGPMDVVVFTNPHSIPLALELVDVASRATRLVADTTVTTTGNSDHASFWRKALPAVSIWEGYDHNPYHCTSKDTPAVLTRPFLVEIARLILAASVHLGGTVDGLPQSRPRPGR